MDQAAPPARAPRRRGPGAGSLAVAFLAGVLLTAAAAVFTTVWLWPEQMESIRDRGRSPLTAGGDPPSVEALMDSAGCEGEIIPPQLFSHETGRCELDGHEVTVATFASNEQRDHWVEIAQEVGSTVVVGDRWAVSGFGAAGPEAFAEAMK